MLQFVTKLIRLLFIFIALPWAANLQGQLATTGEQANNYDVVVIGGTPAGVAAAIGAGRAGKTVMIIEESPVLGGMLSSGVLRLDDKYVTANSGVMEEFRQRVRHYHLTALHDDPLVKSAIKEPHPQRWNTAEGRAWEPHTAARIYSEMVAEVTTVSTHFNEVAVDVKMIGDRVTGVITQDRDNQGVLGAKHKYSGKVIIDATYEADLATYANVPFVIGREARSREEPHAGRIYTNYFRGSYGALPGTIFPDSTGEADDRTQAFSYRLCAKDYGRPDHPFRLKEPPPDYDPAQYSWKKNRKPIIPNNKFDLLGINWGGDMTGYGTRWVLADWEERVEIAKLFRNHDLGWLYYIQTEGGSPNIGLPDDEFTDNNHFPYRLYVRQGRRIQGLYTLNESDVHKDLRGNGFRGPLNRNSVAIGSYGIDAHNVQMPTVRKEPRSGETAAEGTIHMHDATGPYQIPYGVMVPKGHKGILFPVGISSTHVAMISVRMEPVWSELGQAAGIAAALAIDLDIALKDLPVYKIQNELIKQKCHLIFYADLPGDSPAYEAVQKLSLLDAVSSLENHDFGATNLSSFDSDENYQFRPDEAVTLGEFARMAVKGFDIRLSITRAHFSDTPRGHPAYKYIETLYDHSTQSLEPFFDYEVIKTKEGSGSGVMANANPDQAVSGAYAAKIISGLLQKSVPVWPKPDSDLTRGEAAQLVYLHMTNRK
jgi:hypothetical protein